MNPPGMIIALAAAVILMAVIRFGMGRKKSNRWTLAALIPGFLLGAALDGGYSFPVLWAALAAWLAGVGVTAVPANSVIRLGSVLTVGAVGVILLTGFPGFSVGQLQALGFQLPALALWLLVGLRTQGWVESSDPRITLVVLTVAAIGLAWIAHLFDAAPAARISLTFALVMAVGWGTRWLITDLQVAPHIWLAGSAALAAQAVDLAYDVPAASVALILLSLVFFAPMPENMIAKFRDTALFQFMRPLVAAGLCLLPVLVAGLMGFLMSRGAVN